MDFAAPTDDIVSYNTFIHGLSGEFIQYAASSLDHNGRTLGGTNIYHDMMMISAVKPSTEFTNLIRRAKVTPSMAYPAYTLTKSSRVPILFHKKEGQETNVLTYQKFFTMEAKDPSIRHGPHMADTVCITNASMVWDDAVFYNMASI